MNLFGFVLLSAAMVLASTPPPKNSSVKDSLALLEGMDTGIRLERTLTALKTVSANNPTANFWKTVTKLLEEGGTPSNKYRMLSQEFERRSQIHLLALVRKYVAILYDEKFKAAASGVEARKQLSKVLSDNAEMLERFLDSMQYSMLNNANSNQVGKMQHRLLLFSSVMIAVESFFLVTEKLPESEELMKELMPVVDEIMGLRRFAKVELSKEMRATFEEIQTAYGTAFQAYKLPIYKQDIFKYGLGMGSVFSICLATALWILLRRPNMESKAKAN